MPRRRPTAVLVLAILNLVFGATSVLCYLCAGAGIALVAVALGQPGAARDPGVRELREAVDFLNRDAPLAVPGMIADATVSLVLALLLCVAGLGLLGMRRWARYLCLFFAAAEILAQAASLAFHYVYLNPALDRLERSLPPGPAQPAGGPLALLGSSPLGDLMTVSTALFSVAYDVAVLVVLLRPSIAAAFAAPAEAAAAPAEDEGADDLDHEWRRTPEKPGDGW